MAPGTSTSVSVLKVAHHEGQVHPVMGDAMRFIITAAQSGGGYAISEIEVRPGSGTPPHIHRREEEAFYVLEGSFTFQAGSDRQILSKGDFVHVRRDVVRSYKNHTDQAGRLLILHTPGAAADFYIGMGKLPGLPSVEQILALGQQFGIEVVGDL